MDADKGFFMSLQQDPPLQVTFRDRTVYIRKPSIGESLRLMTADDADRDHASCAAV